MSESPDTPGLHGKLPSHGDFITRRLSRGFVEGWDEWLQRAVAASKGTLGEGWLDVYLTSPIWSFVLQEKVCGSRAWAGVLMPSVDRVGRYFPLTLAAPVAGELSPPQVASGAAAWFDRARQLALSSLEEEDFSLDEFDAGVAGLGPVTVPGAGHARPIALSELQSPQGLCLPLRAGCGPESSLLALAHDLIAAKLGPYSLWWSEGSGSVAACLLVAPGLPAPEAFSAMLGGNFSSNHWLVLASAQAAPAAQVPA